MVLFKSKVKGITKLSEDSVAIKFEIPENFNFLCGQFVTIKFFLKETDDFKILDEKKNVQQRSYSISSSSNNKDYLEITVKRKVGGFISDYINKVLKIGDEVEVNGPFGKFIIDGDDSNIVLVAGGSGIAPFISFLRHASEKKLGNNISLIYSSKTKDNILWKNEIDQIIKENPDIKCFHTLTRDESEHEHYNGRINNDMINKCLDNLEGKKFYVCGSTSMVEDTSKMILDLGVSESDLKLEKYG